MPLVAWKQTVGIPEFLQGISLPLRTRDVLYRQLSALCGKREAGSKAQTRRIDLSSIYCSEL